MRVPLLVLPLALALLAAPAWTGAPFARAEDCSPVPQIFGLECKDVPGAGAVALYHDPTFGLGVQVIPTPGLTCGAPTLTATTVEVVCDATLNGITLCANPHAFAAVDHGTETISATAECGGLTAACTTSPFPGNFCFQGTLGAGTFPLTCTAEVTPPSDWTTFVWWVQCSEPVV